jgi:putative nucleotidyltransferase with HDIG domain
MTGLGGWLHLARRFFEVLGARPLVESERAEVSTMLRGPGEVTVFFSQPDGDQRHGLAVARLVPPHLRRAALLHDVGKQASGLGVWGRSLASALAKLHLPTGRRLRTYLDHGPVGAMMLEATGAEEIVVDFARSHHGRRPESIPEQDWELLRRADRKARATPPTPIR